MHHSTQEHIELAPAPEPTWAKIVAPIIALAVLLFLYCAYQHLVR